ncbi:MAG: deoxyribonuclease IV [Thermodesulfobacteriota bacterium]
MRLGFHLSISGGLWRAAVRGVLTGCEAGQIFSRNPRGWQSKPLAAAEAVVFRRAWAKAGLAPLAVHLPYLPNLAAAEEGLWDRSVNSLTEELQRAETLGADFVVAHPGHARAGQTRRAALDRVVEGVTTALGQAAGPGVTFLLETTSGQKGELGDSFEELADLIREIESRRPAGPGLGVCLDTAHVWAAGYDLARPQGLERTLGEFDRLIGLSRLRLVHLNDSLSEKGGRLDRHAWLGHGRLGSRALARIVRHPAFARLGGIMETPRSSAEDDLTNMARAKRWRGRKINN